MVSKRLIVYLLIVLILIGVCGNVSADVIIETEIIDFDSTANPYEDIPEDVYPFIFNGTNTGLPASVDVSNCIEGRLYVYHSNTEVIIEISSGVVSSFKGTHDNIYYVTEDQAIYAADYVGTNHGLLYQCTTGIITNLNFYLNSLYFIDNNQAVIFLNPETGASETVLILDDLYWVFRNSYTELIIETGTGYYLYDITSNSVKESLSEIVATNLMNQAFSEHSETTGGDVSVMSYYSGAVTQSNDISLPLTEFRVTPADNSVYDDFYYPTPIRWFHTPSTQEGCTTDVCRRYCNSGECMGFARYVHDVYLHIEDNNRTPAGWLSSVHLGAAESFNKSSTNVVEFFAKLKTGAYVRYTKTGDKTPADGKHSIVFVKAETDGIWVYECNQDYSGDECAYYGCGIFLQYYDYDTIAEKYLGVLHYVNHSFTDDPVYYNTTYHNVGCGSCNGFVRQTHTAASTYKYDGTYHWKTCSGCGGTMLKTKHVLIIDVTGSYKCKTCGCKTFDNTIMSLIVTDEA